MSLRLVLNYSNGAEVLIFIAGLQLIAAQTLFPSYSIRSNDPSNLASTVHRYSPTFIWLQQTLCLLFLFLLSNIRMIMPAISVIIPITTSAIPAMTSPNKEDVFAKDF